MSDYLNFPPCFFFKIALKNCPECAFLYKELWNYFDKELTNSILKRLIPEVFSMSKTIFRNKLVKLKHQGLLDFKVYKKSFIIDLVPFDERRKT